jgi:hypothetical protein
MNRLVLVVNRAVIDDCLVNECWYRIEQFLGEARLYATEHGFDFTVISDIRKSGFFLSLDGEEKDVDLDDDSTRHFERICQRLDGGAK